MSEENKIGNVFGNIIFFSFASVISLFGIMLFLAGMNNYAFQKLEELVITFYNQGLVSEVIYDFVTIQEGGSIFLPYLDYIWLISFIFLIFSSIIYSYNLDRSNLFSLFNFSVLGIIIITFVGGYFIQFTDWFKTEILYSVFPTLIDLTPKMAWYLDNVGVINLLLFVTCIIANFVDLNLMKFVSKKGGDSLDEV